MKAVHRYGKAIKQKDGSYKFQFKDVAIFRESFREIVARGRDSLDIEVEIKEQQYSKTLQQLRYWKGPLLEVAYMGYRNLGYKLSGKEDAEFLLKMLFYYEEVEIFPLGRVQRKPKSLKDITKEDLIDLIDTTREFINDELGSHLMSPDEWLESKVDKETGEIV